ncbi:MAG: ribonuclease H-like domain-containing protein [Patescibacteria group bacterium]|nr:ribonuclease H-like domain-containing protein [Patescibacteria group bacterium]
MNKIVFDIETQNTFQEAGSSDPADLSISLVGIYDYTTDKYDSFLENELTRLWPILEKADMLIGYNSDHFDIPLLNKYYPGDLTKIKSLDLLKEIKNSFGRRVKLDSVALGTFNKGKIGHGLEAITWWKNGEIDNIRKYCLEDVKITKELYEYAVKNNSVKCREGQKDFEIKLDTNNWHDKTASAMTFTLPF